MLYNILKFKKNSQKLNSLSLIILMMTFLHLFFIGSVKADNAVADAPLPVLEKNINDTFKSKFRIQNYSEVMTPALNGPSVPDSKGGFLAPSFVDGRVWLDYAVSQKYRILYWQRYFIFPFNNYDIYDPRFGLRWTEAFDVTGLTTTYDFYFLPGVTKMAADAHRTVEVGIRTNTAYSIPGSRWDIGFVSEVNAPFYKSSYSLAHQEKKLWGVLAPWMGYKISNSFSTQHWFMFPFKYQKNNFAWDATGMPFTQNGIGWSAHESIWIGAFLNNYLLAAPTLQNSWVSIWLNFAVL